MKKEQKQARKAALPLYISILKRMTREAENELARLEKEEQDELQLL